MNENNELNDIILNKGGSTNNNKKIILAVATLGVILIVVVMLMNSLTSSGTDNLPQTPTPPQITSNEPPQEEALFEEVEVLDDTSEDDNLDAIAARLKEESFVEETLEEETIMIPEPVIEQPKKVATPKIVTPKAETPRVVSPKPAPVAKTYQSKIYHYVQVGSFSKYSPNKKFLKSITNLGYKYKFHKTIKNSKTLNKVLVGPFKSAREAKNARKILRLKVEPGSFLVQI